MTNKIKVLVVDDSAFMRKAISSILNMDPEIEVVQAVPDGNLALKAIPALNPDVVTLDVEMAGMDGIATLRHIMERFPRPVIMVSALTKEGAEVTMDSLRLGAVDFLQKPSGTISLDMKTQARVLIEKVKTAAKIDIKKLNITPAPLSVDRSNILLRKKGLSNLESNVIPLDHGTRLLRPAKKIVAIGVSTGGPQTLLNMIPHIPADISAGILIVQHMPPTFTAIFANRLNSVSQIEVNEARDGDIIEDGKAYLAPGDFHMIAAKGINSKPVIKIQREPYDTLHRPSVDVMMKSAAERFGRYIVAVLLTGMGNDGAEGMLKIRAAGGRTIAEDESTAVIFGMPKAAIKNNSVEFVLPYPDIPKKITGLIGNMS